jgi:LCP family protein required for cell wall assembly
MSDGKKDKRRINKIIKYVVVPVLMLLILAFVLTQTDVGKSLIIRMISDYSYGKLDYENSGEVVGNTDEEIQTTPDSPDKPDKGILKNTHISNILLIGVETFEGAQNTDTMIIASLDSKNNVIKLTSLMRDLYVEIPGYKNNKLNAVYAKDGINLLYDTLETNFGLKMDGYVLVDFNDFEQIIDYLGGIDIELTRKEAQYLRTTNYISNPENRHVEEGVQHMNGNQVLGYCRIRKVSTKTESSDFGRTQRQRIVLEAIFEKLRKKNVLQLGLIMNTIISNIDIKTDITKADYNSYLQQAVYLEKNAIKTFRVPKDGSFNSEKVLIGRYNQDVLVPKSWEDTESMLHDFIYGNISQE